jgi:CRP-like cAMP-binding protein
MALINNSSPIRTADVISITHCSLAMLSFTDFKNICKVYPQFRLKMVFMAKIRKEMNKQGSILSQSALEEAKLTSP